MHSLDIETSGDKDGYALEPWRHKQGTGRIDSVAVCNPDHQVRQVFTPDNIIALIRMLDGKVVWVHNGLFDIAWMLNEVPKSLLNKVKWRDTMLGMKWLLNGQKAEKVRFSYSLDNLIVKFLSSHPQFDLFHEVKMMDVKPGDTTTLINNRPYWDVRGELDAIMTLELGKLIDRKMPDSVRIGFEIECGCIIPLAESWLKGIRLDREKNEVLKGRVKAAKTQIAKSIDMPEGMFTSPKQLGKYLFTDLKLPILERTPKGAPSCGKEVLMRLFYETNKDPRLKAILDFKNIATMQSKFLNGIDKCSSHNGENYSHASPRLFGTITGRMTYSNKTLKKYFIGLAQHQIPREGPIKSLLQADEDEWVVQFDAAAQELRFIGQIAHEQHIIDGFNEGKDLHADMASSIAGWAYETLVKKFHDGDTEAFNFRQAGKLTNLSCQYRIGAKALQGKFFSTYQIIVDWRTALHYLNMYKRQYPGVESYWDDAVAIAKERGYAESIGGRRFRLIEWGSKAWQTESNAINHPIQGSGADHMELAVKEMNDQLPEVRLLTVMHDGIYWAIKDKELIWKMNDVLNNIDYASIWNKEIFLPLPFDGEIGRNFKDTKEFTYDG